MRPVLQVAWFSAALQLLAIVVITAAAYTFAQRNLLAPEWPHTLCANAICHGASPLARLSFLITAIAIALSDNQIVDKTAAWFAGASETGSAPASKWIRPVAAQLAIATFGCIVPELDAPPEFIARASQSLLAGSVGAVLWPAFWSVAVATFGTTAHAALQAIGTPADWD